MLACGPPIMKISHSLAALSPLVVVLLAVACSTPPKDPNVDDNKKEVKEDPFASTEQPADPKKMPPPKTSAAPTPTAAPTGPTSMGSSSPTPSDSSGLNVLGAKSSTCTTDADCRTYASYCPESPCACRVLPKGDPDPTCVGAGSKVQCFVNPCSAKVAHCQSNNCVLVTKQPGGTTLK